MCFVSFTHGGSIPNLVPTRSEGQPLPHKPAPPSTGLDCSPSRWQPTHLQHTVGSMRYSARKTAPEPHNFQSCCRRRRRRHRFPHGCSPTSHSCRLLAAMPRWPALRITLALCALVASRMGPEAAAAAALPPMPSWARGPSYRGPGQWKDFSVKVSH